PRRARGDQRSAREDALQPDGGGEIAGHHLSRHALSNGAPRHQVTPKPFRRHAERSGRSAVALRVDADGVAPAAMQLPSPNCDERPAGTQVTLIVVHGISLPPGQFGGSGVSELFTNSLEPGAHPYYRKIAHLRVSAHF